MIISHSDKPLRILCCPRLGRLGASSRYRFYQYMTHLHRDGFEIDVMPILDDEYLRMRYADGRRSSGHFAPGYARRWKRFRQPGNYDLIWIEKEAFPWLPHWLEYLSLPRLPYVVDYDDAEFHRYDNHRMGLVRFVLGKKIDSVMRRAKVVVAGNDYIAERARLAGADQVELLPTVVDLDRYPPASFSHNETFTIGWIGTPITAKLLHLVAPALREVCRGGKARLVAIGSGPLELPGVPVEVKPWSEESETENLCQLDAGIMPLSDTPWVRGKCGLKLIQYMACARPVVGTPFGVNAQIIRHGENGFQATTVTEWVQALKLLQENAILRRRMGAEGRKIVEQQYSLKFAAPRLANLLRSAARSIENPDFPNAARCLEQDDRGRKTAA